MSRGAVKRKIVVNPEEAEVVRRIYDLYLTDMGAKAVAERLNRDGYSYRGKPWCKYRVLDIIGEEAYVGRYNFNRKDSKTHKLKPREEWIPIPVDPIVDQKTWERAVALKKERAPSEVSGNPAVVGSKTLLTGIAVCGLCGARMGLESAKGGKFIYYNCVNYIRRGRSSCRGQRIPAHRLEVAILDHMANRLFTKERVREILRGVYAEIRRMDKQRDGKRKSLIRQLDVIKGKLTKQYEAIESGVVDLKDVGERIRELKQQRQQIENQLEEMKTHRAMPLHLFKEESIEKFQKVVKEMFMGEDRLLTKRYLKLFVEKIVINLPKIDISCKSSILLAALKNKTAASSGEVLAADSFWLPSADSNHGPDGYR